MKYISTRDKSLSFTSSQAIAKGISSEGGLFVPESIPSLSLEKIESLIPLDYISRAKEILKLFLTDFSEDELDYCVGNAYKEGKFSSEKVAPTVNVYDSVNLLELWRGPTCAFKDMALQLLPYLLTVSAKKTCPDKEIVILVATSGDTGKAALEGFKDVEHTRILVFYPVDGVSPMQKLQMTTQEGENVSVCAIRGNFDDAQNGVKAIFTNKQIEEKFRANSLSFSSANSINWGRLVPQIVYYVSSYCDLAEQNNIKLGDEINVTVPTGNFGNILAAYYAKKMGVPIKKLVCASNANNVLTDFINTGVYDKNRQFFMTASPSMDILISSNLERLLFLLSDMNDGAIRDLMKKLTTDGRYEVNKNVLSALQKDFAAGCCDDEATKKTIKEIYEKYNYLCDTHTAVAVNVANDYIDKTGDKTPMVIASTANPYKFSKSVLSAVKSNVSSADEFSMVDELNEFTGVPVPKQLVSLKDKKPRFNNVASKEDMPQVVMDMLGI